MAQIMILHVSDVHFGQPGSPAQHTNDTQRLIEAAHENNGLPDPDLCIFSGDLTFSGQTDQFAQGERWLKALLEPWPNCRLFVVPGNHEVARPTNDGKKEAVKKWLRSACKSKKDYEGHREYLSKGYQGLLDGFRTWHNAARSERNRLPCLMSDWSECMYGCQWSEKINDINVRVIGLNTSLLSCDNDDKGELVGDLEFLEQSLLYLKPDTTLSIVVAHHPLTGEKEHWLADWNRESIEKRLLQMTGAHLFLHGHLHEAEGISRSTLMGEHLVVLAAGAAYQEENYPKRFAFYQIDCDNQEIRPRTFNLKQTGFWERDTDRSKSFRAILPRVGPRFSASSASISSPAGRPPETPAFAADSNSYWEQRIIADLQKFSGWNSVCWHAFFSLPRGAANSTSAATSVIHVLAYSAANLLKISELLVGYLRQELSQSDLLEAAPAHIAIAGGNTQLETALRERFTRAWPEVAIENTPSPAPPRFALTLPTSSAANPNSSTRKALCLSVESILGFARRAFFEHADAAITAEGGTRIGGSRAILAQLFDVCDFSMQLIESQADQNADAAAPETAPLPSDSIREAELELRVFLPSSFYTELQKVYRLRYQATQNLEMTGRTIDFERVANAFRELETSIPESLQDDQKRLVEYWLNVEQAFCLIASEQRETAQQAREMLDRLLSETEDALRTYLSALANFHCRCYDDAIPLFQQVTDILDADRDPRGKRRHWLYNLAYRYLAKAHWKKAKFISRPGEAEYHARLRSAINAVEKSLPYTQLTNRTRIKALNDLVYYYSEDMLSLAPEMEPILTKDQVESYSAEFVNLLERDKTTVYHPWDTLCRMLDVSGLRPERMKDAAEKVRSILDEKYLPQAGRMKDDELDAYRYATRVLLKGTGRLP